ncbi:fibronectin type III domain-containing protein [Streptomyces sp. NPDC059582]|uniref:fibronectin type III domain-containing protein n=1 Tax=Streptomyces sp. NPDC059582 TaxID=3346875 RepID=UPI00367E98B6
MRTSTLTATTVVLATTAGLFTAVAAPASAAVSCTSPVYKRQFFANTTFSGTAKKTDCDSAIDEKWGAKAPASGLPTNNFAVRWSVTRDFGSGGPFTLSVAAQDGIRVYVDSSRKVDLWKNGSTTTSKAVNLTLPKGRHTVRVDYVNWTGNANVKFAYTPRASAGVDKVKPLAPTAPALTYTQATGAARLTWAKNQEMDLAGYRVYRRPASGAATAWTRLASTTATSYTDAALPPTGETYMYQVRAYDKVGNESAGSVDRTVVTVDRTAPTQVTGLTALGTTAGNSLFWQASSAKDVHHYEVWGAPEGQQDPDGPETVFGTSYTDVLAEPGTAYRYTVRAVDTAMNVGPASLPVAVTLPAASALPAPSGVQGTPSDASTSVVWSSDPGAQDVSGFRVYRRTSATGGWSLIGAPDATASSYEDTSAPRGTAYYLVTTVDGTGAESVPSAQAAVDRLSPATATGPAAPLLTLVSSGAPRRSPVQVTAAPGTGDKDRVLRGYSWEISGACGSSGTSLSTTGAISWTSPYNGPCTATVHAVDVYGRQSEQSATVDFFVGR